MVRGKSFVTMQVGMIAKGGEIVLASDTQRTSYPTGRPEFATVGIHSHGSAKFRLDSTRKKIGIACACDMQKASEIADTIISELPTLSGFQSREREKRMWEIGKEIAGDFHTQNIIVFADPKPEMYRLEMFKPQDIGLCEQMINKVAAGNTVNAAVFFQEAYYDYQPISQLIRLAAYQVVAAGRIERPAIGGLEMLVCDGSGIDLWDKYRNQKLEQDAKGWTEQIGRLIMES
jgi:hypothetical protein